MAPESSTETYAQVYNRSLTDPEGFWADQAAGIPWIVAPENILDKDQNGVWRWFSDGVLNSCHVALDQHVAAGRGDQPALIYDSPVIGEIQHFLTLSFLKKRRSLPVVSSILVSARVMWWSFICPWCLRPWLRCWLALE